VNKRVKKEMSKKYSEAGKGGAMSRKEAPPLKEKQAYNSIQAII
jgi:hypothetical protein